MAGGSQRLLLLHAAALAHSVTASAEAAEEGVKEPADHPDGRWRLPRAAPEREAAEREAYTSRSTKMLWDSKAGGLGRKPGGGHGRNGGHGRGGRAAQMTGAKSDGSARPGHAGGKGGGRGGSGRGGGKWAGGQDGHAQMDERRGGKSHGPLTRFWMGGGREMRRASGVARTDDDLTRRQHRSGNDRPVLVHVAFMSVGPPSQMESSVSIIRNIEALASRAESIRYHLVVDRSPSMLRLSLSRRSSWHGMPLNRLTLHSVAQLPASVIDLHRRLSSSATGPGPIYLWKPIFHRVLPEDISKVIILDTDVFLFTDIQRLWNHFRNFGSGEMLGIAQEQCPSYQEVRALGGVGYNGGVQLLDLFAMRSSADYNAAIETYAAARWGKRASAGAPPMKDGGIGWLGDQTLYSWMSVNSTGHRRFFHDLPCGWNRQIGTHMSSWPRFWRTHACHMPCRLLHGNFVEHKGFMEELKADPTGASCTDVVDRHRLTDPKFKDGTADARMLDVVRRTCCPANVTRLVGSNKAQRPHPP